MVVADGVGQEVGGLVRTGELDDLLCAAEVGLGLTPDESAFGDVVLGPLPR